MCLGLALLGCAGQEARADVRSESTSNEAPSCVTGDAHAVGDAALRAVAGESNVFFRAGLSIDADGAPRAYHRDGRGLDHLANAGRPGSWWGLVTDARGEPVVQTASDPAPGYFVSRTSLEDRARAETDPHRYVDATRVPYVVLPGGAANRAWLRARGVSLGDLIVVHNQRTGRTAFAIWADVGPAAHLGEGSIALAEALGYPNTSARNGGGAASENLYLVLAGTSRGWPRAVDSIAEEGRARFADWGGLDRLTSCE